jgi:hypothetical protein
MNPKSWPQFRTQLFDIIEKRRAIASIFRYEQIYWFISGCRRLFASPATKEVQDELNAIQDEGTFLLVADSLTKFLTMFEEAPDETSQQPTREAAADRDVVRLPPVPHQTTAQKAGAQVSSRTQVSTDARRRSGRPF